MALLVSHITSAAHAGAFMPLITLVTKMPALQGNNRLHLHIVVEALINGMGLFHEGCRIGYG